MASEFKVKHFKVRGSADDKITVHQWESVKHTWPRHSHPEYKLGVSEGGTGTFFYRGERYHTGPGKLLVIHPNEAHTCSATGAWRYLYAAPSVIASIVKAFDRNGDIEPLLLPPVIDDSQLAELVLQAHRAMDDGASQLDQESAFYDAICEVLVRHASLPDIPMKEERANIRRVQDSLEARFNENVSLHELAELAGTSAPYLSRVFSKEVGMPIQVYLSQVRVRRAQQMLMAGETPANVAYAVGFTDQSHFTRHFKRLIGVPPGTYSRAIGTAGSS
ncbi:HTH-type transcriptional activator Btr [Rubripirellula amarantea]|uniref:HTH-type transcriptional activator Btr n=1 Tax=Rubripirellula amarantea TaxID=2527999 RepID=A0A5C5WLT1_9BACT|nr:AraC family transcriptional regulator [Rubripirellula amarantea]TWT50943.1 HTH-type transcriptional activator Btr [Rubripirellula amarantea]